MKCSMTDVCKCTDDTDVPRSRTMCCEIRVPFFKSL